MRYELANYLPSFYPSIWRNQREYHFRRETKIPLSAKKSKDRIRILEYMGAKSSSCFSRNGKSLTEYYTEMDASDSADFIRQEHGNDMIPYHCEKCGLWHLAPKNRQTPSKKCSSCTDSYGKLKELYYSREDAQRRAEILFKEQGVRLKVYKCPENDGFHLTKD